MSPPDPMTPADALRRYGRHFPGRLETLEPACNTYSGKPCDCDYDATLARFSRAVTVTGWQPEESKMLYEESLPEDHLSYTAKVWRDRRSIYVPARRVTVLVLPE